MLSRVRLPAMCASVALATCVAFALYAPARADDAPVLHLTLKDHHFTPARLDVPVDRRFRIQLENQDETNSEFESYDMKIEKIVVAGGKILVWAGPLHPGTYKFFDDYHPDLATGVAVAASPDASAGAAPVAAKE